MMKFIAVILAACLAFTGGSCSASLDSIRTAATGIKADDAYQTITTNNNWITVTRLSDDGICGCTDWTTDYIEYEGLAGLKTHCDGTKVDYTMYSNSRSITSGKVWIFDPEDMDALSGLGSVKPDVTNTINFTDYYTKPGTYGLRIEVPITTEKGDFNLQADAYLYYDGKVVKACRRMRVGEDAKTWYELVGKLDPNKCLGMYVMDKNVPITYPTSGRGGDCDHVEEWRALSHEIITNDEWSDEYKVFRLVHYVVINYAYDDYRVRTLRNASRATEAGCWTDDNLWCYYNKVGQCWDFENIMTIMCREQGIPCTSVENKYHTLNAVWMYGEWVAIDVSQLVEQHCETKDTAPSNWVKYRQGMYFNCYGVYYSDLDSYNQCIATPRTTLYPGSDNPI